MNKQEAIENINGLWSFAFEDGPFEVDLINKRQAIDIISQIDESQKPYDWLNPENKRQAELNTLALVTLIVNGHNAVDIKQEKLYTVEIPNPNGGGYSKNSLAKNKNGKVELFTWSGYTSIEFADDWKQEENAQLTEAEIKKDFEWAWQFAKEVEQCNQRL